jgi:hypothetical protein
MGTDREDGRELARKLWNQKSAFKPILALSAEGAA